MLPRSKIPGSIRRLRAASALRGLTLSELASRCQVCDSHLRGVITGERRPSERLVEALKEQLGDAGWAFVRGQTDELRMPDSVGPEGSLATACDLTKANKS